jgi:hypothetical protein
MNETLREALNLPNIGGEIVAHFERCHTLRRKQWSYGEEYFITRYRYDSFLEKYYSRKIDLQRTIKKFKEYHKSDVIEIFEYRLKRTLKPCLDNDKYNKIKQCVIKANEWLFDEELISELLQVINEVKLFQIVYEIMESKSSSERADFNDIERLNLNRWNSLISEYEQGIRKINIRLRGIRKVFGDKSDSILKMIEKKSYNYSLSSFEFTKHTHKIIDEAFKLEPQKLYRADWYLYVNFAGPDRRYLDVQLLFHLRTLQS